jgi:hypothetical protein
MLHFFCEQPLVRLSGLTTDVQTLPLFQKGSFLRPYLVAGTKLNPLCTFRAEGDWSLIQNSLSGVLDLYYAIALMSLPSKCRMS